MTLSQGCYGYFGSDSSKSTKFGPDVAHVILFGILIGAKTGASRAAILAKFKMAAIRVRCQMQFKN